MTVPDAASSSSSPAGREALLRTREAAIVGGLTALAFAGRLVAVTDLHPSHQTTIAVVCVLTAVLGAYVIPRGTRATNAIVRVLSASLLSLLLVFGALGYGAVRPGFASMGCGGFGSPLQLHFVGAYIEGPLLFLSLVALFVTRRSRRG
jgi:hypothetical protein